MQNTDVSSRPAPSRRALLTATAWSVPVIAATTAAPAYAASGGTPARLSFNTFNMFGAAYAGGTATRMASQAQVQNDYYASWPQTSATLTSLIVTVTYTSALVTGAPAINVTGTGWSAQAPMLVSGQWVYRFTYSGTLAPGSSTTSLAYQVPVSGTGPVSATAIATGSPATDATRTASATV